MADRMRLSDEIAVAAAALADAVHVGYAVRCPHGKSKKPNTPRNGRLWRPKRKRADGRGSASAPWIRRPGQVRVRWNRENTPSNTGPNRRMKRGRNPATRCPWMPLGKLPFVSNNPGMNQAGQRP